MKKSLVCGLAGAAAFLAALFALHMRFTYAALLGLGVWLVLSLLLREDEGIPAVQGMTRDEVQNALREGERKAARLRAQGRRIGRRRVAVKVETIADVADRILADLRQDPKDIRSARRFLEYYLDATLLVVTRYVDLSDRATPSEDVQEVLGKFEGLLDAIQATFEKQHERLLRDDVLDLDTDITVLQQMMKMEGL